MTKRSWVGPHTYTDITDSIVSLFTYLCSVSTRTAPFLFLFFFFYTEYYLSFHLPQAGNFYRRVLGHMEQREGGAHTGPFHTPPFSHIHIWWSSSTYQYVHTRRALGGTVGPTTDAVAGPGVDSSCVLTGDFFSSGCHPTTVSACQYLLSKKEESWPLSLSSFLFWKLWIQGAEGQKKKKKPTPTLPVLIAWPVAKVRRYCTVCMYVNQVYLPKTELGSPPGSWTRGSTQKADHARWPASIGGAGGSGGCFYQT